MQHRKANGFIREVNDLNENVSFDESMSVHRPRTTSTTDRSRSSSESSKEQDCVSWGISLDDAMNVTGGIIQYRKSCVSQSLVIGPNLWFSQP